MSARRAVSHRPAQALAGAALVVLIAACAPSSSAIRPRTTPEVQPTHPGVQAAVTAVDRQAVEQGNAVGIAVLDRASGELALNPRAGEPMFAASLSKVLVVVELLEQHRVTERDQVVIRRALGASDDEAMNVLWANHNGSELVTALSARLGLQQTRAPDDPARWGETVISARDIAVVFAHLLGEMPDAEREFVLAALHAAPQRAADGFDQAFGLMAHGAQAVKNGWACCRLNKIWLHSAGVVDAEQRRFVVVLLTNHFATGGYDRATAELTDLAGTALSPLR